MTRPMDPPAPEGYEVHEGGKHSRCIKCVAVREWDLCNRLPCGAPYRPDGRWVYFTRAAPKETT